MSQIVGIKYTLTVGTNVVTFNDDADPNFAGYLSSITGLDSPEVRESADDLVEADGGQHGNFYFARRPVVLEGVLPGISPTVMETQQNKIKRAALNMLRQDGVLSWIPPSGGETRQIRVRLQQPLRFSELRPKRFLLALVSAQHYIEGTTVISATSGTAILGSGNIATLTIPNTGEADAYPVLSVTLGTGTDVPAAIGFLIDGEGTFTSLQTLGMGLSGGVVVNYDLEKRTVTTASGGTNLYPKTTGYAGAPPRWFSIPPGGRDVTLTVNLPGNGTGDRASYSYSYKRRYL